MKEILIPLASALATAVGGILVAWLLARVRSGRLVRTLDQTTKIIDFIERWSARQEGLAKLSEANRNEVDKLMLHTMQAVREDFVAERAMPIEFGQSTSSIRSALLLHRPRRAIVWFPHLLFYTLLLFMIYVFVIIVVQGRWNTEDTVALLIAGVFAALLRLTLHLFSARE
jgi:hypothetical protein